MITVANDTIDRTEPGIALREQLRATVAGTIENHPGPDLDALVEDLTDAIITRLRLHASKLFVNDSNKTVEPDKFRVISGRLDVIEHG